MTTNIQVKLIQIHKSVENFSRTNSHIKELSLTERIELSEEIMESQWFKDAVENGIQNHLSRGNYEIAIEYVLYMWICLHYESTYGIWEGSLSIEAACDELSLSSDEQLMSFAQKFGVGRWADRCCSCGGTW